MKALRYLFLITIIVSKVTFISAEEKKNLPYCITFVNEAQNIYASEINSWLQKVYQQLIQEGVTIPSAKKPPSIYVAYEHKKLPDRILINQEMFYTSNPITSKRAIIIPKNPLGTEYSSFHTHRCLAEILLADSFGKNFWLKRGLSISIANQTNKNFVKRNYLYLALMLTDKNETLSIEELINQKETHRNEKNKIVYDAHSWLLYEFLKEQYSFDLNYVAADKINDLIKDKVITQQGFLNYIKKKSIGMKFYEKIASAALEEPSDAIIEQFLASPQFQEDPKKSSKELLSSKKIEKKNISKLLHKKNRNATLAALDLIKHLNDRLYLNEISLLILWEKDKEVKKRATEIMIQLNMGYYPHQMLRHLHHSNIHVSINAVQLMYDMADDSIALAAIENINGPPQSSRAYIAVTTTKNYISDYDVVGGRLDPVVSTVTEGVVLEVNILWITHVQAVIISSLNIMKLGMQHQTADQWVNWGRNP